ncbi:MAG: cytochrome c biogenesis protein CcsA [Halodesulfurarchaeum sp.]
MVGNILIYGAVGATVGSTAVLFWAAFRDDSVAAYGRYLLGTGASLLVLALGVLTYQFVVTDYTNSYVWGHTADYLSLFYRLTGVYAGINGSLLLWAALVGVFAAWLVRRPIEGEDHALVAAIASAIALAFSLMSVVRTPFEPLTLSAGRFVWGPSGLNPLLINPYMGIHPPVTFAGYALTVVPFAIAIAHLVQRLRGKPGLFKRWLPRTMAWLRLSWIFLTAAVALGAIWSYNTLGWGGLWAWDPVETAVLVSWLVVSMTVHAVANFRRRGQNALLAAGLTAMTFPGVIFARLITQSGASPLHSFGQGVSGPLLALLLGSFALSVGLPVAILVREGGEGRDLDSKILTLGNMLFLSVLVIGVLTFISVWGIAMPMLTDAMGQKLDIGVNFYNLWSYPVAVGMLLLLGLYNDYVANGRRALPMLGGVTLITLVVAVLPVSGWTIAPEAQGLVYGILGSANALVLFPPVAYVIIGVADRLWTVVPNLQTREEKLALGGRGLVHVGLALIILASPYTYLFATSGSGLVPVGSHSGGQGMQLGDSPYVVHTSEYQRYLQPNVSTFTPAERRMIRQEVSSIALPASAVEGRNIRSAIVAGTITGIQSTGSGVAVQVSNTSVWVPLGNIQVSRSVIGAPIYAQGTVNSSGRAITVIEASPSFVGSSPIDAVVPTNQFVRETVSVTVTMGGAEVAKGRAGVRRHVGYGRVSEILIERGLLADTYVAPQQFRTVQGQNAMYVRVKQIPVMNLVRLGIVLMLLGGTLILVYDEGTPDTWDEEE